MHDYSLPVFIYGNRSLRDIESRSYLEGFDFLESVGLFHLSRDDCVKVIQKQEISARINHIVRD
jgi:hypothetical protein